MKNAALMIAGLIFTAMCALQLLRFYKNWEVVIAQFTVPVPWSLYAGIVAGILALVMFIAVRK
ncbi:MAG: hypothetical protein AB7I18_00930 [Candidatus Berkiella sp.]